MFVDPDQIREVHRQEGHKALAPARARLDAAGQRYVFHVYIGDPSKEITAYAEAQHCDQICMGTRGHGGVAGVLLGSVSAKVIHLSSVPVLLIK